MGEQNKNKSIRLIIYYAIYGSTFNIYVCIICSEEKRFIVTAAVNPARLYPILYAYICITRIGVYIIIRGKYNGGDEFSGKNI